MKHLEPCPEQEMLSLLSRAQLTCMIDRQMAALHNEQVAYFSQKGSIAPDDPSVLGKEHKDVVLSRFILVLFFVFFFFLTGLFIWTSPTFRRALHPKPPS